MVPRNTTSQFVYTRFFSGKKRNTGYNKMTFEEKMYKAKMQNIWYIQTNHIMWPNCSSGISGTIPPISGTIAGISGTKKTAEPQKALWKDDDS